MQCSVQPKVIHNLKSLEHKKGTNHSYHHQSHHARKCKDNEFQCSSDGACIVDYKKCNNIADCSDHSDEINCVENTNDYDGKNQIMLKFIFIFF